MFLWEHFYLAGIDSSTIVALMQIASSTPIKTFTIGFSESDYSEAENAKKIANHLGTNHTELYLSSKIALDVIPKLPEIYDEPFSDSCKSQPIYCLNLQNNMLKLLFQVMEGMSYSVAIIDILLVKN